MASLVRKLLFPAPDPPDYDDESFPDDLIWVPQKDEKTGDTAYIPCIFLPFKGAKKLVLYCHGNGCDLGTIREELLRYRDHWEAHVLALEYPGYGLCHGIPDENSINNAIFSVYTYVTKELRWPSQFLFLYGRSIGTGPACKLVSTLQRKKQHVGGLILQCAYTSIKGVVNHAVGVMASALVTERWRNIDEVKHIECPVLLIHGQKDSLIPYHHSETLYDELKSQHKQLVIVAEANHNKFDEDEDIKKPILNFITRASALMQKTIKYYKARRNRRQRRESRQRQETKDAKDSDPKEANEKDPAISREGGGRNGVAEEAQAKFSELSLSRKNVKQRY